MSKRHHIVKALSRRIIRFKRRARETYGPRRERWPVHILEKYEEMKAHAALLRAGKAKSA